MIFCTPPKESEIGGQGVIGDSDRDEDTEEARGTVRGEITNLTHREHAGIALSHFFFVRVHFSHARWARSTVSSMGELELRGDPEPAVIVWFGGTRLQSTCLFVFFFFFFFFSWSCLY
jgi:hypothetical protein